LFSENAYSTSILDAFNACFFSLFFKELTPLLIFETDIHLGLFLVFETLWAACSAALSVLWFPSIPMWLGIYSTSTLHPLSWSFSTMFPNAITDSYTSSGILVFIWKITA
jgi:hypothetical protein